MHRLKEVRVENFASVKAAVLDLADYTPLVGYNNAGKSNLLNAVIWVIGPTVLQQSSFNDPTQTVKVEAVVQGISADVLDTLGATHKSKIEPFIDEETLRFRRVQDKPGGKASDITLEIWDPTADTDVWKKNPTGIANAIKNLLPEPIFIGAMENATDDVGKFASGTTIGKLLKLIMDPITQRHASDVQTALATVSEALSANGAKRDPDLVELDNRIAGTLSNFFPGVTAKAHIPVPELGDFIKSATMRLYEGGQANGEGRDAAALGHGAQRSVQFALIQCLSLMNREKKGHESRTTMMLLEEPELYLHPHAIETVKAALRDLSTKGYQIVFTTHSANMIDRDDAPDTCLVRKIDTTGTTILPKLGSVLASELTDHASQAELLFSLTQSTKILFAEKVVLVEGITEDRLLPDLYHGLQGSTLGADRIGPVRVNGSGSILKAMSILDAMGMPTKAIVDLDFCFRVVPQTDLLADDDSDIIDCKAALKTSATTHGFELCDQDLPKNGNNMRAEEGYRYLVEDGAVSTQISSLHDKLKAQGVWVWKEGSIEAPLQLAGKKTQHHSSFLSGFKAAPDKTVLPYHTTLQNLCDWLSE